MEPTASERLDIAIAALKKCEERSLAGQFALEMMHEIRNPLDLIGNLVHLAGRTDNPEVIRQYLREAEEQILAVYQIAGQGLTFARGDQAARSIDLFQLAEAAIRVHHRRTQSKRIHIKRDLGRSEMVTVRPGEIVQVLSNLIGNSLDAIPDGGTIAFRIRRRGDFICICISDNGHGISEDNLTRLFQPFFTTKNGEGNGLGLALSKKIIDRHGGSISVRSCTEPFRCGTTFCVCLPLSPAV